MPTREDTTLPNDPSEGHMIAVHRPSALDQSDAGLAALAGLAESPESSANLGAYFHSLRRHWAKAAVLGLASAMVLAAATFVLWGSKFTASAWLQVGTDEPSVVELDRPGYRRDNYDVFKYTQQQLVKSPGVLSAALREDVVRNLKIVQREADDKLGWLEKELHVDFPGESEVMVVSLTDKDPEEVTILVNAVKDAYLEQVVDKRKRLQQVRLVKLNAAYQSNHTELRKLRTALQTAAAVYGTEDPDTLALKQRLVQQQLGDTRRNYAEMRSLRWQAESDMKGKEQLLDKVDTMEVPVLDVQMIADRNPVTRRLAEDLAMLKMQMSQTQGLMVNGGRGGSLYADQLASLQATYDEQLVEIEKNVREQNASELKSEITELSVAVAGCKEQEKLLTEEIAAIDREVKALCGSTIEIQMTMQQIDQVMAVLDGIATQRDQLKIQLSADARRIESLQNAIKPESADDPEIRIAVSLLAGIIGLCLPCLAIVWWDSQAKRVNTSAEVSKTVGVSVIGAMPKIPSRVIRRLGSPAAADQHWHLRLTESVDGVAASLLRKAELEQKRVVLVTSAVGGEGKTTLATQLAMSLARSGRRTVLVDFDLRRPAFDEVFAVPLEPGISEVLRGENELTDVIHVTGTENLSVVTAGRWDRRALAALANGAAGPLLDELRSECEFVIIDSSPILPVADTRIVSQHVDSVLLSVFRDVSQTPKLQATCEILESFGVSSVEAVVTGSSESPRDKDLNYEPRRLPA